MFYNFRPELVLEKKFEFSLEQINYCLSESEPVSVSNSWTEANPRENRDNLRATWILLSSSGFIDRSSPSKWDQANFQWYKWTPGLKMLQIEFFKMSEELSKMRYICRKQASSGSASHTRPSFCFLNSFHEVFFSNWIPFEFLQWTSTIIAISGNVFNEYFWNFLLPCFLREICAWLPYSIF